MVVSLVAQWLRICLPMQRAWVQSLLWEDSTCVRTTKPQLPSLCAWSLCSASGEGPQGEACTLQLESISLLTATRESRRRAAKT